MDDLEAGINQIMQEEIKPTHLVRKNSQTLYHQTERKGIVISDNVGYIIRTHLPGNYELQQTIWDKDELLDVSSTEIHAVLKKVPANAGNSVEQQLLKRIKGEGTQLYYPIPPLEPQKLFDALPWEDTLNYWVGGGTEKDERLMTAFKSCVVPFPKGEPAHYQPLNNHQIWVTNSGTGKSTFNLIYGNSPVQELTAAGLFGSNDKDYKGQIPGLLQGAGMFMIDEVSDLTVSNRDEVPLVNLLLSYLEQGEITRAFKKPIICKGTKTIILNSNPRTNSTLKSISEFVKIVGGCDDKVRIGRRFGIFLFGSDFKSVDLSKGIPLPQIQFIQRTVKSAIAKRQKSLFTVYQAAYKSLASPDDEMRAHLKEVAEGIDTFTEVRDLLIGMALATPKVKTAGFKTFLAEHLDMLYANQTNELIKMWKKERDEYYNRIFQLNLRSFESTEKARILDRDKNTFESLLNEGYTQAHIAHIMGISAPAVTKLIKKRKAKRK